MKTILIALMAAVLLASQLITPVAADSAACGNTYTVAAGDYLYLIAGTCGTTVASILALNPQVTNQNMIYQGQVLRLNDTVPVPASPGYPYYPYYASYYYYPYLTYPVARVGLSSTKADVGDSVTVYVSGYPANSDIDYRVAQQGEGYVAVYDGTVSKDGSASMTIAIPSSAARGEYWVIEVITTSQKDGVDIISYPIYITDQSATVPSSPYARVSLSSTSVVAGGSLTVYVSGYPAGADIDFRVGKQGDPAVVTYDGVVSAKGTASQTITIPSGAVKGDNWVVVVATTSQKNGVTLSSGAIYISK